MILIAYLLLIAHPRHARLGDVELARAQGLVVHVDRRAGLGVMDAVLRRTEAGEDDHLSSGILRTKKCFAFRVSWRPKLYEFNAYLEKTKMQSFQGFCAFTFYPGGEVACGLFINKATLISRFQFQPVGRFGRTPNREML